MTGSTIAEIIGAKLVFEKINNICAVKNAVHNCNANGTERNFTMPIPVTAHTQIKNKILNLLVFHANFGAHREPIAIAAISGKIISGLCRSAEHSVISPISRTVIR